MAKTFYAYEVAESNQVRRRLYRRSVNPAIRSLRAIYVVGVGLALLALSIDVVLASSWILMLSIGYYVVRVRLPRFGRDATLLEEEDVFVESGEPELELLLRE